MDFTTKRIRTNTMNLACGSCIISPGQLRIILVLAGDFIQETLHGEGPSRWQLARTLPRVVSIPAVIPSGKNMARHSAQQAAYRILQERNPRKTLHKGSPQSSSHTHPSILRSMLALMSLTPNCGATYFPIWSPYFTPSSGVKRAHQNGKCKPLLSLVQFSLVEQRPSVIVLLITVRWRCWASHKSQGPVHILRYNGRQCQAPRNMRLFVQKIQWVSGWIIAGLSDWAITNFTLSKMWTASKLAYPSAQHGLRINWLGKV